MTLRTLIWVSGSHLFVSCVQTVRKSRTRCTECVVVSTLMIFRIELLVLNSQNSPNLNLNPAFPHVKQSFVGSFCAVKQRAELMRRNFQLPLCPQDAVQREGAACFQGLCPVAMASAVNGTTPTSQLHLAPSFRSVPKGLMGAARSAAGTNNGGRAERAARGQREEAARKDPSDPPRAPPPACWVNFEMGAATVAREALVSPKPPLQQQQQQRQQQQQQQQQGHEENKDTAAL